ncbi:MAG: glycosyltransferase [Lachnospiraceae bacterium]|nr:glycosyltransferase [Lachnospiraceae bacterium]
MKICLLNDSYPPMIDGVANTVLNYARVLTEIEKQEVVVGTPRYPGVDYRNYPYRVIPYQSFNISSLVYGYRAGNPLAMKDVGKLADFMPDIIHTHCPVSSTVIARILRGESGAPVIFTYHTKFDQDIARAVSSQLLQKGSLKFLVSNISAADEVWVVSRGAGENLRSIGYQGDYRVVENGVDFDKGRKEEAFVRETVKDYDLPAGVPVYLFVGRIMKYKGLPLIIKALARLKAAGQDFRMVFVGGGVDMAVIKALAEQAGLSGKVIFTGPVRDREVLRAWNTRADLFLFPSTYDTNGIVVREAAACGLASVLIKDSCAAEGVTDGRNGFLIDETPEAMCAFLQRLGSDTETMKAVGQHAMDEIYISWEDSVRHAYDLYQEVIENKQRGVYDQRIRSVSDRLVDIVSGLERADSAIRRMEERAISGLKVAGGQVIDDIQEIWRDTWTD